MVKRKEAKCRPLFQNPRPSYPEKIFEMRSIDPRETRHLILRALDICRDRHTGGVGKHLLANWPTKF